MRSLAEIFLGIIFVLLGILVFKKSGKWVKMTMDMWPFWKLSTYDETIMKICWKLFGIFLVVFGLLAMLGFIE